MMNIRLPFMMLLLLPLAAGAACNANITETKPDSRYTDNGDGTVTDTVTGLMWKQCSEGLSTTTTACDTGAASSYSWQGAMVVAKGSGFAGHDDWRLPNRNELASLVETKCYSPSINDAVFPNTESSYYWSSSPYANNSGFAWLVDFDYGYVYYNGESGAYDVRLVRAGQ